MELLQHVALNNQVNLLFQRIHWSSSDEDRELCLVKGKGEDDCQNYMRVLARVDHRTILVCGTNSFSPLCRHYTYTDGRYTVQKQFSGRGYAPYDPRHNSTSLFTGMIFSILSKLILSVQYVKRNLFNDPRGNSASLC
jgi:semaphorin 6